MFRLWRARRALARVGRSGGGADRTLAAVDRLLEIEWDARGNGLALVRRQVRPVATGQPAQTLAWMVRLRPGHLKLLGPEVVTEALRSWAQVAEPSGFPELWQQLEAALGRTPFPLYRHLETVLGTDGARVGPVFRELAVQQLLESDDPHAVVPLLTALGPLDAAAWWCVLGDLAVDRGRPSALDCYRQAGLLGSAHAVPRLVYLTVLQARARVAPGSRLPVTSPLTGTWHARFLYVRPQADRELALFVEAVSMLTSRTQDPDRMRILRTRPRGGVRTELVEFWLAVAEVRAGNRRLAVAALRRCLRGLARDRSDGLSERRRRELAARPDLATAARILHAALTEDQEELKRLRELLQEVYGSNWARHSPVVPEDRPGRVVLRNQVLRRLLPEVAPVAPAPLWAPRPGRTVEDAIPRAGSRPS